MKTLIYYSDKKYIKDIRTDLGYFEYACHLRDQILNGLQVETFLNDASINDTVKAKDMEAAYKIENGLVYFYEYAFSMWECANDYHDYESNPDAVYPTMPKTIIDGEESM